MFFNKPKQNSNKINRRFTKIYRRFGKMKRRLVFPKRRFAFLRIFVLIGRVGSCGFESKAMVCRLWLWHKEKKTIDRIVLPIVFLCVALCD